ncbi:MAG TPA: hypothetical protein VHT29_07785 [Solirubrobacteraceae bacterium]|nr:hypothetical protein [Solirubrobacteraceae bacterium]
MAQLSRPYQIALGVLALLAVVWVIALRPHSTNSSGAGSSPAATPTLPAKPAAPANGSGSATSKTSSIYHGSAPGVQGLTRAIAKAHGAVSTSEQNAKQLTERSAQASSTANPSSSSSSSPSSSAQSSAPAAKTPSAATGAPKQSSTSHGIKAQSGAGRTPARQALVERALEEGKPAVILFWSKSGADDVVVHDELLRLEAIHHMIKPIANVPVVREQLAREGFELTKPFASFEASSKQVSAFGTITQGVQIYSTPTILIVAKGGKTTVITGLTDAFAIEQAIDEARHPSSS